MTAQALNTRGSARRESLSNRPVVDVLVERAARNMLAWSERRAQKNVVSHERRGLILGNQRAVVSGGSALAR